MSIRNHVYTLNDFLRFPRPQGERRKSIYSPWGWVNKLIFIFFSLIVFNKTYKISKWFPLIKQIMRKLQYDVFCIFFFFPIPFKVFWRENTVNITGYSIIPLEARFFLFHYPVVEPAQFIMQRFQCSVGNPVNVCKVWLLLCCLTLAVWLFKQTRPYNCRSGQLWKISLRGVFPVGYCYNIGENKQHE